MKNILNLALVNNNNNNNSNNKITNLHWIIAVSEENLGLIKPPNTMRRIITRKTTLTMSIQSMALKVQAVKTKIVIVILVDMKPRRMMDLIEMIRKHGKNSRNHIRNNNI